MSMTLQEIQEHVAEALPNGMSLNVTFFGKSSLPWVGLSAPDRPEMPIFVEAVTPHRDLEATVLDALSHAQAEAR